MFHLKRFVLHWAKCILWYPANSATYLQVVINHTMFLFVFIIFHLLSDFKCSTRYPSLPPSGTVTKAVFPWRCSWRFYPLPLVLDMNGSCWLLCVVLMPSHSTWSGKRPIIFEVGKAAVDLPTQPLVFGLNDFWGNERRISKLMTRHYPDLILLVSRKFASSNKHYPILVVTRHQYEIFLFVPQASFRGETTDDDAKFRLLCQSTIDQIP